MLGDPSEFTALDMLGSLAVNAAGTNAACKTETFRTGMKGKDGDVKAWADYRFLGGVAAAVVGQFGGPMVRRAGHDAAVGLLGSYVATETCRKHAIARIQASQSTPAPQAIPAAEPAPAPAEQGAPNYAYGW